jgi:hypothetical protein
MPPRSIATHTRTHFCVFLLATLLKYVYKAKIKLNNLNCAEMLSAPREHTQLYSLARSLSISLSLSPGLILFPQLSLHESKPTQFS